MATGGRQLPAGMVTFVVTDIEGSTRLLRDHGDDYGEMLEQHHGLLRRTWARHGGRAVDRQGDGSLAAFATADDAVLACARAQEVFGVHTWPGDVRPRVRMGVHTGVATPSRNRYVSIAVHQATRVGEAAHGGQILVSESAAERVTGIDLQPLGRFRVRDFDQPVALFQPPAREGEPAFAPPRCLPAEQHNLREPPTRLIGRQNDLAAMRTLLAGHRLITLVGAGGVGKTRLAIDLGRAVADTWRDGVWLVDCGPVEDPGLLPAAVGAALGLRSDRGASAVEDLCAQLGDRRAVLIMDGCERHTVAAAHLAAAVLGACPRISVVVTSTEPLHLPGEVLHRLEPLPTSGTAVPAAAELFLERAAAVQPGLVGDLRAREAILAICRRLDGLPLALEIVAARVSALHPVEILSGLDGGLRLLRVKDPTRPTRQQGLDALLDWNVGLLSQPEDRALQRLSLLPSAFDLSTARAAISDRDIPPEEIPDLVWSLVDKSLLVADPAHGGTRYRALETVRIYARERLTRLDRPDLCAARLADYFLTMVGPSRGTSRLWLDAIATELDNIRSVVAALGPEQAEVAQELACSVARYHASVQSLRVGLAEVTSLAERWPQRTRARGGLLIALGDLHTRIGDFEAAIRLARQAAELRAAVGAPDWDEVGVEKLRGEAALALDRAEEAVLIAQDALTRALGARGRARMWNMLGIAQATSGRLAEATVAFQSELAAAVEAGDDVLLVHAHSNAAEIALRTGAWREAATQQRASLEIAVSLGQPGMIALGLLATARLATTGASPATAPWPVAVRLVAKAEALLAETGLALYSTDSQVTEQFVLQAREHLGPDHYHQQAVSGRALDPSAAALAALAVLDTVASDPRGSPKRNADLEA